MVGVTKVELHRHELPKNKHSVKPAWGMIGAAGICICIQHLSKISKHNVGLCDVVNG